MFFRRVITVIYTQLQLLVIHLLESLHQAVTQSLADSIARLEDNNSHRVAKILRPAAAAEEQDARNVAASALLWDYKPPMTLAYLRTTYSAELQASKF